MAPMIAGARPFRRGRLLLPSAPETSRSGYYRRTPAPVPQNSSTRLMKRVEPPGAAIFGVPSAAVREDAFAALTLGRYGLSLATLLAVGPAPALSRPFPKFWTSAASPMPF